MNYNIETFIQMYNELDSITNTRNGSLHKISRSKLKNEIKKLEMELNHYGEELLKCFPEDKKIVCIVYSGVSLGKIDYYKNLGENIKRDKLCTLLALNNFDCTSFGYIPNELKNDKQVMFTLANNTEGALSITQFSPELTRDEEFMADVFACAYQRQGVTDIDKALYQINRYNEMYFLNLDLNSLINASKKAKTLNKYQSKYDTSWISSLNPNSIIEILDGNIKYIEDNYNQDTFAKSFLLEEAQSASSFKLL